MKELLQKYLFLLVIFALFIVFIFALTLVIKNKKGTNYYLYGLLMNMKTNEIYTLSLIAMNFVFLSYVLIFKIKLNLPIALISTLIIIIAFSLIVKPKKLIINLLINFINIALIFLANLINTLKLDNINNNIYLFLQIVINLFGLFFYIFTHLKFIKDIRKDAYGKDK